jgi:orotidine-5'-phosphate decarboxylase
MFDELQEASFSAADWAEVTKLKRAFEEGGQDGLVTALEALVHGNRACYLAIMEVLNPGYGKWHDETIAERAAAAGGPDQAKDK